MGVTVKKMIMIMSGNDCWNSVCFSCCRKADTELADVTLSGRLFQNCAAATGNARPPMANSLNGGIRKRFDPAERSAGRPDTSATWTNELSEVAWWASMQSLVCQNSHFVQYPFWSLQPVETDKCVSDVVASSQMTQQTGGCVQDRLELT